MNAPEDQVISCESPEKIVGSIDLLMPTLNRRTVIRLNLIKMKYLQLFGIKGLHERVNNRSISQILSDFDPFDDLAPIAMGEIDGLRYELYEAGEPAARNDKPQNA